MISNDSTTPRRLLPAALVAAVTLAVFLPSLGGQFLNWDDDANFTGNARYRGLGAGQLHWMWTDHFGHYIPLTWMSFGLDYVLWGMNPTGYHAVNVVLHAIDAVLFFLLLLALLRRARPGDERPALVWIAAAGALFFSLHPQRVESVAWVTERRGMLTLLFILLSLHAWLKGIDTRRPHWFVLSVAAFAASVLCKSLGMTLPIVMLLLDFWPLRRYAREKPAKILLEKVPYFLVTVAAIAITSWAQNHADAIYSRADYPLTQSLAQPGYRISFYLLKTLAPFGLSPLYFYRPQLGLLHALGWAAMVGITALVLWKRRQWPAVAVGWLAFGALIAPFAGLTQIGPHFASDRNTYLAALPLAALFAGALALPKNPRTAGIAAAVVLLGFAALSLRQIPVWRDSTALWTRAIDLDPDVYYSRYKRGTALSDLGRWTEAIADFDRAVELNPAFAEPWFNRGVARASVGDHAGAVTDFNHALERGVRPTAVLSARGLSRGRLGDRAGAVADCDEAVRLDPGALQPLLHRGLLRFSLNDFGGAITDFSHAVQIAPESPSVYYNRGLAYSRIGRAAEAVGDFTRALELRPLYPEALSHRGALRAFSNDAAGGMADLNESLRLKPDPATLLLRASAKAVQADFKGAIQDYSAAIEMNPAAPEAWSRRGAALLETGDRAGAARDLSKALELAPPTWPLRRQTEELLQKTRQ